MTRDPAGALSVIQSGPWRAERKLGIADDDHGAVTAKGFAETWVALGNGGRSTVTVETMHHRIMTGDGADLVRVTGLAPASGSGGTGFTSTGFISTGAGNDVIELGLRRLASDPGAVTAAYEVWAGAGNDRIVIGDGIGGRFSGGSGDDVIVSGRGDEDLRGDVGIDTVELPGVRAAWRFTLKHDADGRYLDAIGPGGHDRMRGFEWVVFGDATVAKFGELVGDRAPTGLALTTAGLAPGVVARATATDPEGGPLTWFLSDTAGKRFAIDPFSGEIALRPGAAMAPGARYELGIGVVDAAGNVAGATLAVGAVLPATMVTLSNTTAADLSPLYTASWTGTPAGARILTAADLARLGPAPDARVSVVEAAGVLSVSVLSAWNSVKNVRIEDGDGGTTRIDNAVHAAFLGTGDAASTLIVSGAKRANLATGAGNDTITVEAFSNVGGAGNRIAVDAGAGNDRVVVTGHGGWTTAHLAGGLGSDVLVFSGGGGAVLDGGLGADTVRGGEGRDRVILRPGEVQGDRLEGFAGAGQPGGDWLVMEGFGAGAALTHQGNGLWRVSYTVAGEAMAESFTVVGVSRLGADDVIWA
jgi:Ca2+-binding RTX toxin-like protein